MRLFTSAIDNQLFKQFNLGNDLSRQKVVAKIFNPYGRGTWYILNSDPNDPDYLWAIVNLHEVEIGSVSRKELESIRLSPFGLKLERDRSFRPINAKELYEGLREGKHYGKGGDIHSGMHTRTRTPNVNSVKFADGGFVDLTFNVTKIYSDGKGIKQNIIDTNWTIQQFYDYFKAKKYKQREDDTLIGFHFDSPDGDTYMLVPKYFNIANYVEYAKGGSVKMTDALSKAKKKVDAMSDADVISETKDLYHYEMLDNDEDVSDIANNIELARKQLIDHYEEIYEGEEMTGSVPFKRGGEVGNDLEFLKNKIRTISKKMEYAGESGYGGLVVYLDGSGNKIQISNYSDLAPYSAQANDTEIKVSFNAPNKTMVTFSNRVNERFEDNKSFEKYGGLKYVYEPLTDDIASEIIGKVLSKKYAKGGSVKPTTKQKKKIAKVMHEWKQGDLHIGKSDKIVTDQKQAVAIALSQSGLAKKKTGWKHKRK